MKILTEKTYNGATIKGDAIMLSKYGEVYNAIDNLYHPNPGPRDEGYPEIERCIDWCYDNHLKAIYKDLDVWIKIRVAQEMEYTEYKDGEDISGIVNEVMYADLYTPCDNTINAIKSAVQDFKDSPRLQKEYSALEDIFAADKIVNYINEKFMRVRAGGKLNPEGTNSIYFRISSHGYDWNSVIQTFLWDVFGEPKKMPRRIVICHDAENNPPEKILFDGTPEELFTVYDNKIFEIISKTKINDSFIMNRDRLADKLNKLLVEEYHKSRIKYISFK